MSKQTAQNLNLIGDCVALVVASAVATGLLSHGSWHWMVFLGMSGGSMLVWTFGGRTLRHYDVWNGRGIGGDVALTALLLGAMLTAMGLLRVFVPRYAVGWQQPLEPATAAFQLRFCTTELTGDICRGQSFDRMQP